MSNVFFNKHIDDNYNNNKKTCLLQQQHSIYTNCDNAWITGHKKPYCQMLITIILLRSQITLSQNTGRLNPHTSGTRILTILVPVKPICCTQGFQLCSNLDTTVHSTIARSCRFLNWQRRSSPFSRRKTAESVGTNLNLANPQKLVLMCLVHCPTRKSVFQTLYPAASSRWHVSNYTM